MMTAPRVIAREIAAEASARSGRRFLVHDSESGFGLSSYVIRDGHLHYHNLTVRVSDHSCATRQRQLYVWTDLRVPGDQGAAIETAIAALVKYADEEAPG